MIYQRACYAPVAVWMMLMLHWWRCVSNRSVSSDMKTAPSRRNVFRSFASPIFVFDWSNTDKSTICSAIINQHKHVRLLLQFFLGREKYQKWPLPAWNWAGLFCPYLNCEVTSHLWPSILSFLSMLCWSSTLNEGEEPNLSSLFAQFHLGLYGGAISTAWMRATFAPTVNLSSFILTTSLTRPLLLALLLLASISHHHCSALCAYLSLSFPLSRFVYHRFWLHFTHVSDFCLVEGSCLPNSALWRSLECFWWFSRMLSVAVYLYQRILYRMPSFEFNFQTIWSNLNVPEVSEPFLMMEFVQSFHVFYFLCPTAIKEVIPLWALRIDCLTVGSFFWGGACVALSNDMMFDWPSWSIWILCEVMAVIWNCPTHFCRRFNLIPSATPSSADFKVGGRLAGT